MIGRIDEKGFLIIKRGNSYLDQYCPFFKESGCGHWCPHFSEPDEVYNPNGTLTKVSRIQLCLDKIIYFDEFIDERRK